MRHQNYATASDPLLFLFMVPSNPHLTRITPPHSPISQAPQLDVHFNPPQPASKQPQQPPCVRKQEAMQTRLGLLTPRLRQAGLPGVVVFEIASASGLTTMT